MQLKIVSDALAKREGKTFWRAEEAGGGAWSRDALAGMMSVFHLRLLRRLIEREIGDMRPSEICSSEMQLDGERTGSKYVR